MCFTTAQIVLLEMGLVKGGLKTDGATMFLIICDYCKKSISLQVEAVSSHQSPVVSPQSSVISDRPDGGQIVSVVSIRQRTATRPSSKGDDIEDFQAFQKQAQPPGDGRQFAGNGRREGDAMKFI